MKKKMLSIFAALAFAALPASAAAIYSTVLVDTNGVVQSPTNFASANNFGGGINTNALNVSQSNVVASAIINSGGTNITVPPDTAAVLHRSNVVSTAAGNVFTGTNTFGTITASNFSVGGLTISVPTNIVYLTNSAGDFVDGFFTPVTATLLTNQLAGSFIVSNSGAWRVLASGGQEHYNIVGPLPVGTWSVSTYGVSAAVSALVPAINGPAAFGGAGAILFSGLTANNATLQGSLLGTATASQSISPPGGAYVTPVGFVTADAVNNFQSVIPTNSIVFTNSTNVNLRGTFNGAGTISNALTAAVANSLNPTSTVPLLQRGYGANGNAMRVIYDDDFGSDPGDEVLLNHVLYLHEIGAIHLVAVTGTMHPISIPFGAPLAQAICQYYGYGDIPVGSTTNLTGSNARLNVNYSACWMTNYPQGLQWWTETNYYHLYTYATNMPEAVGLWRKVLADSQNSSVCIFMAGDHRNFYDFLQSQPDKISPMTGVQLFSNKVSLVLCASGIFVIPPGSTPLTDTNITNFAIDGGVGESYAAYCFTNLPSNVPVIYWGQELYNTYGLIGQTIYNRPHQDIIQSLMTTDLYNTNAGWHNRVTLPLNPPTLGVVEWEEALLYVAFGTNFWGTNVFSLSSPGMIILGQDPVSLWVTNSWTTNYGNQQYLICNLPYAFVKQQMNNDFSYSFKNPSPVKGFQALYPNNVYSIDCDLAAKTAGTAFGAGLNPGTLLYCMYLNANTAANMTQTIPFSPYNDTWISTFSFSGHTDVSSNTIAFTTTYNEILTNMVNGENVNVVQQGGFPCYYYSVGLTTATLTNVAFDNNPTTNAFRYIYFRVNKDDGTYGNAVTNRLDFQRWSIYSDH
jgi:hypothetical protein